MNTVKKTSDYDKFKFIDANRDQNRGHVEKLKAAFDEIGNLTRVQPILVNEKFQIIDGQHRFVACKELEQPIYYTQVPGLGVTEARSMNILHRTWKVSDYANSYAVGGNKNYQQYIQMKEDYGFGHSIILACVSGETTRTGEMKEFRQGLFVVPDEDAAVDRLEYLSEATENAPIMSFRPMAVSLIRIMQSEVFDRDRMLKKLKTYKHKLERVDSLEGCLRQLEDVYNLNVAVSARQRLY